VPIHDLLQASPHVLINLTRPNKIPQSLSIPEKVRLTGCFFWCFSSSKKKNYSMGCHSPSAALLSGNRQVIVGDRTKGKNTQSHWVHLQNLKFPSPEGQPSKECKRGSNGCKLKIATGEEPPKATHSKTSLCKPKEVSPGAQGNQSRQSVDDAREGGRVNRV